MCTYILWACITVCTVGAWVSMQPVESPGSAVLCQSVAGHQCSVFPAIPGKHSQADQRANPTLLKILHTEGLFHHFTGMMSPVFGFTYWHFKAPNYMSRRTFKEEDTHPSPHSTNSNSRIFIKESWPTNQRRNKMPMTLVKPTRGGYRSGWLDEPFLQEESQQQEPWNKVKIQRIVMKNQKRVTIYERKWSTGAVNC